MLSATVGSLDDVVGGQFDAAPEVAAPDFSEEAIGLPSGVSLSLLVCPVAIWSESGSGQLAPTPAIETNQSIEANGSLSGVIDDSGLLLCTFPPATFSLSGDADFGDSGDSIAPPTVDPGIDGGQDTVVDPTIIVDPGITDVPTFEPVDTETGVFALTGGVDPIVETFGNPDPTIIVCPGVSEDWDFGPADGWSYDGSFSAEDPTLEDGTDPVLIACDGYPLAREFCVLPMPVDFTSGDGAELGDSGLSVDVSAYSTVGGWQSPTESPSENNALYGWMAAFAANLSGAGGDSTEPVTGRRRSR